MIDQLAERANADEALIYRGRFVDACFLLEADERQWLIKIAAGRVTEVLAGPFVMPRWTFALRAPTDSWRQFWSASPPPGYNDLFALLRFRRLEVEGDMHVFMANLFYFKALLALLRPQP